MSFNRAQNLDSCIPDLAHVTPAKKAELRVVPAFTRREKRAFFSRWQWAFMIEAFLSLAHTHLRAHAHNTCVAICIHRIKRRNRGRERGRRGTSRSGAPSGTSPRCLNSSSLTATLGNRDTTTFLDILMSNPRFTH